MENENQYTTTPFESEGANIRTQAIEKAQTGETTLTTADIQQTAQNIPTATPLNQWDIVLLVVFVGASLLYGITNGKKGTAVMTIAIYMALAVTQTVPDMLLDFSANTSAAFQVTTFIGVFALIFYFLSRSALLRTFSIEGKGSMIHIAILALLHAGLLLAVAISFIPSVYLQNFSPYLLQFFIGEWQVFGWVVAPIVAMFVLGNREK